jgi:hypothetical protein
MKRWRVVMVSLLSALAGLIAGGILFSQSQPRSFIALKSCENCASPADLAGLLASVGIQKLPGALPLVVFQTDKTIAFKLPVSYGFHYVIVPRKDLKDLGDISRENAAYLVDAFLVIRHLIEENHLVRYSLCANGPGYQRVTYLHFHLTFHGV